MTKITILGTASAVPNINQENAHFIVESDDCVLLVDCVGNPVVRMEQAGVDPTAITDIVLTHFHPDHVSGVPLLLMDLWLMGREKSIAIHGLSDVIDRIEKMMALYDWQDWGGFYPVIFNRLPEKEQMVVIDKKEIKIWASPVCHMIPAIGIRMAFPGGTVCYSADTGPCDSVLKLAQGVDILIHEATGQSHGHSSAAQAGEIAQRAAVGKLYLIHYPKECDPEELVKEAQAKFSGQVDIAKDLMIISL